MQQNAALGDTTNISSAQVFMSVSYKDAVLTAMEIALKSAGFHKRAANFHRVVNDVVQLVQLQSSSKSSAARSVVTVNLGVFSRTLERALNGPITEPIEVECHWRERIGFLDDNPRDIWWEMTTDAEAHAAALAISTLLQEKALVQFEDLSSTAALQELWRNGRSPGLTARTRDEYLRVLTAAGNRVGVT